MIGERDLVIGEMAAWAQHRMRRVTTRTATENQLLSRLDRAFPGLTLALPDVVGTRIGRLIAAEFTDPTRLTALGVNRLIRFAAVRDVQLRRPVAERLVAAAKDALPTRDAVVARRVLATDVCLLADWDSRINDAETELARLLPLSPCGTLTSVSGWGVVRASNYAAALGDPAQWPGPKQIYRASGLSPMQYESAGRRPDGSISRQSERRQMTHTKRSHKSTWAPRPPASPQNRRHRTAAIPHPTHGCRSIMHIQGLDTTYSQLACGGERNRG